MLKREHEREAERHVDEDGSGRAERWRLSLVVGFAAFAVYANTLANDFVFDDVQNILQNRWIRSTQFLPEIFTHHVAGFDPELGTSYYRPAMHLFYLLAYQVFGLAPWGFHLVNVLLHAGVSILVLWIGSRVWKDLAGHRPHSEAPSQAGPLLAALVFAVHPIHTEAVAWLAGITDLSFTFFALLAFHLFVAAKQPFDRRNLLAALAFLAATSCKEPALTFPIVLLGYDILRRRQAWKVQWQDTMARLLPFAVAGVFYMALRLNALGGFAPSLVHREWGAGAALANGAVLFVQYWSKLVWPVGLSALHSFQPLPSPPSQQALLAIVPILGLIVFAVWARRRSLVQFALLMVIVPLLPALYVPALGEGVFAERYLYLPVLGFALLLAQLVTTLASRTRHAAVVWGIVSMLLAGYGAGTIARNVVWRNSLSLWTDAVAKSPDSAAAHEYLGFAQYSAGQLDEAIASYRRALALDPTRADSHLNLGVAYAWLGRQHDAIASYESALLLRPDSAEARTSLGLALVEVGQVDRGVAELRAALDLNPFLPAAHNNLGVALIRKGLIGEAVRHFADAVTLDPSEPTFRDNLSRARALAVSSDQPPRFQP